MGRSLDFFAPQVDIFRRALWEYVCFNENGEQDINVPLEHFRPFAFIDCMQHSTCQPGSGPRNEEDERLQNAYDIQRAFFTTYGKKWGMKTQAIYLPNGMIASVFFTSISQNDNGLVNISGVENELERVLENH